MSMHNGSVTMQERYYQNNMVETSSSQLLAMEEKTCIRGGEL